MATGTPTRPPAGLARPRAVDESMSLLRDVTNLSLDPGYRRAKEAERSGGVRPARALSVVILVAAVALGCVTVWAVRELRVPAPVAAERRTALLERVDERTAAVKSELEAAERLRNEVTRLQKERIAAPVSDQLDELTAAAAQTAVQGPGLRLTLRDGSGGGGVGGDPRDDGAAGEWRVLDRDLQIVVNALWAAGAEAIAINGQRLSALSAIRGAGEAVLVDFQPLVPPYQVTAIGNPARLQSGFASYGGADYLQALREQAGIGSSMAAVDQVSLPAVGQPSLRWARIPSQETSGNTSQSSDNSDEAPQEENP